MKITVTTTTDKLFFLDVSEDLELENFKAICIEEGDIAGSQIIVVFNGKPLNENDKPLKYFGIKDGDCVMLQVQRPPPASRPNRGAPMDLGKLLKIKREKIFICKNGNVGVALPNSVNVQLRCTYVFAMFNSNILCFASMCRIVIFML